MFSIRKLSLTYLKSSTLQTFFKNSNFSTAKLSAIAEPPSINDSSKATSKTTVTQDVLNLNKDNKNASLVAQAFASLQTENKEALNNNLSFNDKRINNAKNINELLSVVSDGIITRQHALKIVSVLAQWSTTGKVDLKDFETDVRFVKICRILSRPNNNNKNNLNHKRIPQSVRGEDLSMVLGVAGDDEAAKLVASITLPQMVKVMTQLSHKKRRSTPLLRALAYNISRSAEKLDLKQSADLLYSMTLLNFPEPVLLERIGNDIIEMLNTNDDRTAVIGSILTSIGLMRYKEPALLDALSEWVLKHHEVCRPQDIFSLILTLATTNYHPENSANLFKVLIPQLEVTDAPKPTTWLDLVWSLVVLNEATETHILSIFNSDFINKLEVCTQGKLSIPAKVKLLNINAAVHLMQDYKGPLLKDVCNEDIQLPLARTKDKQIMVSAVLDSLASLLPSQTYLRSNIDTKMGFYIDGLCTIDKKCNPLPVDDTDATKNKIRVAIMAYDFHDMCRGTTTPHGGNNLAERLLNSKGYKVLTVPYNEFNPRDKVVQRVKYLEKHLKEIASKA